MEPSAPREEDTIVNPPIPLFPRFFLEAGAAFFALLVFFAFDFAFFAFFAMIIFRCFRLPCYAHKTISVREFFGGLVELVINRQGAWPHFPRAAFHLRAGPLAAHRRRRAAEQRDELAALHSITSSAVASSQSGIVTPSAFVALRLITSSNFVGRSIGKSAGCAP